MPGANRELFNAAHYNVIAKRIRTLREIVTRMNEEQAFGANAVINFLVEDLGSWFQEDNPRFERDTWMEATNYNESA